MPDFPTLRLYLVSLPGEMDGERTVIEGLVLPELRSRAEARGLAIELVDPSKAEGEEWDLARRFREIDSCRPFFLALLGERYGDPPLTVPLDLVAACPWLAEDPGRSVLELEILHAALRDPGNAAGAFFYFRHPGFPAMVPSGFKAAAVLAVAVLGFAIFALQTHFGNPHVKPPRGHDFETYDLATWKKLAAACGLSGEEGARLASRAAPGASMAEIAASPNASEVRQMQRRLESRGTFLLPRQTEQGAVCAVVLDPKQPQAQKYLRSLGTKPRTVTFPRLP